MDSISLSVKAAVVSWLEGTCDAVLPTNFKELIAEMDYLGFGSKEEYNKAIASSEEGFFEKRLDEYLSAHPEDREKFNAACEERLETALEELNYFGTGSYESLMSNLTEDTAPTFEQFKEVLDALGYTEFDDDFLKLAADLVADVVSSEEGDLAITAESDGSLSVFRKSTGEVYQ